MVYPDINLRRGTFIRGFFKFLDSLDAGNAVLHDWQNRFDHDLSDVDYVIAAKFFLDIPHIVSSYCDKVGWRLCQVIRHETTAAFCVCSALDDPACAVALDACSDYQRNGTLLIGSEELLAERIPLPWGGCRLSEDKELQYRFIKAAAKRKHAAQIGAELAAYADESRWKCERWLQSRWGVRLNDWSTNSIDKAFSEVYHLTCRSHSLMQPGSLIRLAGRIRHPSGLLAIIDHDASPELATTLLKVFGSLYFRNSVIKTAFNPLHTTAIIRSTLIITNNAGCFSNLLPKSCRLNVSSCFPLTAMHEVADFLHCRIIIRENVRH